MNNTEKHEKVIKGLKYLHDVLHWSLTESEQDTMIRRNITKEAIELLKAQEPRVLTLAEVLESEVLYAEDIDKKDVIPVLFNARWGDQIVLIKPHLYGGRSHKFSVLICDYGKRWRCWNKKPTDKQQLEVEWE